MKTSKPTKTALEQELRTAIETELERLQVKSDRVEVLHWMGEFIEHLNYVQSMPLVQRLVYFRVCFPVFNYLRRLGQLGRSEDGLDTELMENVYHITKQLIWKYRHE